MSLVKFTNVPYNIYNFPMDVTRQKLQDYLFIYKKNSLSVDYISE